MGHIYWQVIALRHNWRIDSCLFESRWNCTLCYVFDLLRADQCIHTIIAVKYCAFWWSNSVLYTTLQHEKCAQLSTKITPCCGVNDGSRRPLQTQVNIYMLRGDKMRNIQPLHQSLCLPCSPPRDTRDRKHRWFQDYKYTQLRFTKDKRAEGLTNSFLFQLPPSGNQLNDTFTVMLRSFFYIWGSKPEELYVGICYLCISHYNYVITQSLQR